MVRVIQHQNNRINISENTQYKVISCIFTDLINPSLIGGAIFNSVKESYIYCNECSFFNCSAKQSGGIHISSSANIVISSICAISCSNKEIYSSFAYLNASKTVTSSFFSTHFCHGHLSTILIASQYITVENYNMTNNDAYQEPSLTIWNADYCSSKYLEISSNTMNIIGLNFYEGNEYISSHIHYNNCSFKDYNSDESLEHILSHNVKKSQIFDSYIAADDNANAIYARNADVKIHNIYLIGMAKIHTIVSKEDDSVFTIDTKTLHYSFLSNDLCPADIKICNTIIHKYSPVIFYSFLYTIILK